MLLKKCNVDKSLQISSNGMDLIFFLQITEILTFRKCWIRVLPEPFLGCLVTGTYIFKVMAKYLLRLGSYQEDYAEWRGGGEGCSTSTCHHIKVCSLQFKGTVSRDGFFFEGLNFLISTFCSVYALMVYKVFQTLFFSLRYRYPIQLWTFYLQELTCHRRLPVSIFSVKSPL